MQKKINEALPKYSCTYARVNKSKFRIFCNTIEIKNKLVEYLAKRGYHFNTYMKASEKYIHILIKNTDIDDPELIREELQQINIEPVKIQRHITGYIRKNKIQPKIWHLILQPNTDTSILFKKRNIGHHIVRYEYMKKPEITQCKRCQRFSHAASSCYLPYRCVKCALQHEPGQCTLNNNNNTTKPKCANCGGEHTANDAKKCPVFQKAIELKNIKKEKLKNKQKITVTQNKDNNNMMKQPLSSLFKQQPSTRKSENNTPKDNNQQNITQFIEHQQHMISEFLTVLMKGQNEFLKNALNGR